MRKPPRSAIVFIVVLLAAASYVLLTLVFPPRMRERRKLVLSHMQRVRQAVLEYRVTHGALPESLDAMATQGTIPRDYLRDARNPDSDGFVLVAPETEDSHDAPFVITTRRRPVYLVASDGQTLVIED